MVELFCSHFKVNATHFLVSKLIVVFCNCLIIHFISDVHDQSVVANVACKQWCLPKMSASENVATISHFISLSCLNLNDFSLL